MRIIARLDIKNEFVIKGIHLEGLRKVGNPNQMAQRYYHEGIDEIIFMDAVASLYDRNSLFHILEEACKKVFVPIAIGGGLRTVDDVSKALNSGADKVVINTGAVRNIRLVEEIANRYGSQCLIGSIEAKQIGDGWRVYTDNGREPTNYEVLEWVKCLEEAGVGEILVTSVDKEGTSRGFDVSLIKRIQEATSRPIIVSGGYGVPKHFDQLFSKVLPSAIAFAGTLHYEKSTVSELRAEIDNRLEI